MKWRTIILAAVIGAGTMAAHYRFEHACSFKTYFHALAGIEEMNSMERVLFSFILTRGNHRS